jgi:hypothetical protein
MPQGTAQYIGMPRGRFAQRNGVGTRTVDLMLRATNPRRNPHGEGVFKSPKFYGRFQIAGVTRDSVGTPLGSCDVRLFKADSKDQEVAITVSDGSGNFTFNIGTNEGYFWIEAYKSGSPDLAGTSLRTLVAVMV